MVHLIDKDALLAEIENLENTYKIYPTRTPYEEGLKEGRLIGYKDALHKINTLEVEEVGVWKTVDNINHPQADKNKIYCIFTKGRYILAKVINHPKDEELLQWKCTEFPHHRYDMCEGDKYIQIV